VTTDESTPTDAPEEGGDGRHDGMVRVKVRVRRSRRGRRRLLLLAAALVVVLAGVALALLARPLVSAKHEARAAQADLTAAKDALSHNWIALARAHVRQARVHVDRARTDSGGLGGDVWSVVPVAGTAVDDERHLVSALDQTTSVAEAGVEIYPIVSGRNAKLVRGQRIDVTMLQDVADRTASIGPHLDQAILDLSLVKGSTPVVGDSIERATNTAIGYLKPLQESYQNNEPLLRSLPALVGADGPRTYLLAMLNPAEQRYSGGGALSFTTMRFDKGLASFGNSSNVDDILRQGDQQSWPPVPGNTFHRTPPLRVTSSTFSPWWSVSSEELLRGYQKAFPGTHFDGVVGIDLQGLAQLFRITGPVDLPTFGRITADNLVSTLAGSYGNFDSIEQRHQLNQELVPAFRQQFFEGGKMQEKVKSLVTSAKARHFFLYFRNDRYQRRFARVGLSGDLSASPYDYVGVFSQNVNGSKTDYWQHREVTSTVQLKADGSADVRLHVKVTNGAPPYTLPVPDPRTGYTTRYLTTRVGIFMPHRPAYRSMEVDGRPSAAKVHLPTVAHLRNRKYVEGQLDLDYGQSGTIDVAYGVPQAAEVIDSRSMIYTLTADPQDLVTPEVLHVTVTWPDGFKPTGTLPQGWTATATGATYAGSVIDQTTWRIPIAKS
jgi:Protein of unknown function (DUF4012)